LAAKNLPWTPAGNVPADLAAREQASPLPPIKSDLDKFCDELLVTGVFGNSGMTEGEWAAAKQARRGLAAEVHPFFVENNGDVRATYVGFLTRLGATPEEVDELTTRKDPKAMVSMRFACISISSVRRRRT
jgi:hypothetical protein